MSEIILPNWTVVKLNDDSSTGIRDLMDDGNKIAMVIDFWTSKCVKCPAAIDKLNEKAPSYADVIFSTCALSQGGGNFEIVKELIDEG